MNTYDVTKKAVQNIISSRIKLENNANKKVISKLLLSALDNNVGIFIDILLNPGKHHLYKQNDIVKTDITYHIKNNYSIDALMDLGLYEDGKVYCKIINSSDWRTEYDPFYKNFTVEFAVHNEKGAITYYQNDISQFDLEPLSKEEYELVKEKFNKENV